tara:strand:- start:2391 stop:2735 length:345 start_codon:yes stop_codon:yes gene_type:complete
MLKDKPESAKKKYKTIKHSEAPKELKFTKNEARFQTNVRKVLTELDKLGLIVKANPDDGIIRRSFINQVSREVKASLDKQIRLLRATAKASTYELKIRVEVDDNDNIILDSNDE